MTTDPTPPVVPAGQEVLSDLAARLAAADIGWAREYGDPPAEPAYILWLARLTDPEVSRLQAIVDRVRYDPVDDTWQMDAASQEHMDGLYQQAEEARAERDEARRVVGQVNDNCADFAEALGLPRDSYGDQIIEAARQLRTEAMEVAESNKALRAERDELHRKLHLPCGSCHPCANWTDEAWRREPRKPPTPVEWDSARAELAALRASTVTLPEDWREQLGTALLPSGSEATASAVDLIESWRAPTVGDTAREPKFQHGQSVQLRLEGEWWDGVVRSITHADDSQFRYVIETEGDDAACLEHELRPAGTGTEGESDG